MVQYACQVQDTFSAALRVGASSVLAPLVLTDLAVPEVMTMVGKIFIVENRNVKFSWISEFGTWFSRFKTACLMLSIISVPIYSESQEIDNLEKIEFEVNELLNRT